MSIHSIEAVLVIVDELASLQIWVGKRKSDGFIFICRRSVIRIGGLVEWDSNRQLVDFISPAEVFDVGRVD